MSKRDSYRARTPLNMLGRHFKVGEVLPGPRQSGEVDDWIDAMPDEAKARGYKVVVQGASSSGYAVREIGRRDRERQSGALEQHTLDRLVERGLAWPPGQPKEKKP